MTDERIAAEEDAARPGREDVPAAATLDEATLRSVFVDAPADTVVPSDVRAIFRSRMRTVGGARRRSWILGWSMAMLGSLTLVLTGTAFMGGSLLVLLLLIGVAVLAWRQHAAASDDFFARYASARGLRHEEDGHIHAAVPLFGRGDEREWPRVLRGSIAGQPASLGLYRYTVVTHDTDGDRNEANFDFTVLHFPLPPAVAERFPGVYLSPRKLSFGALQDKLAHDRKVELESIEFGRRYTLRVDDDQDDVALYELFSPTFIHRLSTELRAYWEQRGGDLVIYRSGHETEAADLDRFCLEGWHVLHRYFEEFR